VQELLQIDFCSKASAGDRYETREGENMNIKIGKSQISISAEGCFRCGTLWSSGWYSVREVSVRLDEKSVRWITLHICNDCATPDEKIALQQNDSDSAVQMILGI